MNGVHPELAELLGRQPYTVTLDGLTLTVAADVFPPDLGRCARILARVAAEYSPRRALDMGTGTGYLALVLKAHGACEVWALDVHEPAVRCTRRNAEQNPHVAPIVVARSDLYEAVPPGLRFDLVVFNQPFAPSDGPVVCGCGSDGGRELTARFLEESRPRLEPEGAVVMPFSDRAAPENDPARVARELGWRAETLVHAYYGAANNFVYELRP